MKKDKTRLVLITAVTIILLVTVALYAVPSVMKEGVNSGNLVSIAIPLIVIAFAALLITRRYRDIKQGMPMEDERSKKVVNQAAAKSFFFSLYWLLALSMFESFFAKNLFGVEKLDASQTVGGAICGMAIFFMIFWLYYNKKGQLD